jgi:PAS domain S-box-containing protein
VNEVHQFDLESNWQNAPCGLLITDEQGVIRQANRTLCSWLGYRAEEIEGSKKFSDLLPMGARIFHLTHWTPLLQIQGSISEVQMDVLHTNGKRVPMILNAIRRKRDTAFQDEIAVFVATDRKRYESELLRARERAEAAEIQLLKLNEELGRQDRMKDQFLATLAHELRNPLAPLVNGLQVLKLRPNDSELWSKSRAVFERQVGQLGHLVDDLLEVSRITQAKLELRKVDLDLQSLLEATLEATMPLAEASQQHLRLESSSRGVRVFADPTRLTQIVSNLLNNAVKFTPVNGTIILRASSSEDFAVIEVIDNGAGIPEGQLGRIFEMFSQVSSPEGNKHGGLGIGLALVKGLTELHGGEVQVESEGIDRGSVFTVTIPLSLSSVPVAVDIDIDRTPQPLQSNRILVVDDNIDAAETLQMALEFMGHRVRSANSGAEALRSISDDPPECVLLDIGLPDFSGHDVARRIRATETGAPIILIAVTGWGQDSDKLAAQEAGFDAHVTKPIDFQRLNELIADCIRPKQ